MPRGGRRTGTPGRGYANRTDLGGANRVTPQPVTPGRLPAQATPGGPYGSTKAQLDAQRAVPMATQAPPPPSPVGPVGAPPSGLPQGVPAPGSLPPLDAPTDRPNEPLTTGVPAGAGAGPEVLAPLVANPLTTALGVLAALGDAAGPQTRLLVERLRQNLINEAAP